MREAHYYLGLTFARRGRKPESDEQLETATRLEHEQAEHRRQGLRISDPRPTCDLGADDPEAAFPRGVDVPANLSSAGVALEPESTSPMRGGWINSRRPTIEAPGGYARALSIISAQIPLERRINSTASRIAP